MGMDKIIVILKISHITSEPATTKNRNQES